MPGYNKYRARRYRPRKRAGRKNTGASKQYTALARKVRNLSKQTFQYAQFEVRPNDSAGSTGITLGNGEFHSSYLIKPQQWISLFQTHNDSVNVPQKMKVLSADLQFVFSPSSSLIAMTPRIVRVWIMKLKKETSRETLVATQNMTTSGLNDLVGNDYVHKSSMTGGLFTMIKWNPAAFRCLKYREFTLANIIQETAIADEDDSVSNTKDALKRVRMKFPLGNILKVAKGPVMELNNNDIQDLDRTFVIVHVGGFGGLPADENAVRMDTNWVLNTKLYV